MTQNDEFHPTEEQSRIIALSEGRHLVLAPPGTGKTEMLSYRVLHALERGIPPEKMLCLTFTVRAAMEMKDRIRKVVPYERLPELGNVHHFCHHFLYSRKLIPQQLQVVDEDMQSDLMLEVTEEFPKDQIDTIRDKDKKRTLPINRLLKAAASLRQFALNFPEAIVEPLAKSEVYPRNPELVKRITTRYHDQKKFLSIIDFDDLLAYTYYFLAFKSAVTPEDLCVWVQVDEVQDLNPLQWAIIEKLSTPDAHATYFGDREQSIFSFMGASAENFNRVTAHCTTHNLIKNFRSNSYLLDLFIRYAIKTLQVNWDSLPLPGTTVTRNSADMQLVSVSVRARDTFDEKTKQQAYYIADLLKSNLLQGVLEETGILVSTNKMADAVASALERPGYEMAFFKVSGFDLFSRLEFRDFKAYCAIFNNSTDRMAWSRLFKLFGKLSTQKEARGVIKALFDAGFVPADFLSETYGLMTLTYLEEFRRCILRERVVVFDTETTGLNRHEDEIIQIAAVEYVAGVPGRTFEIYINTSRELGDSEAVHKITRELLVEKGIPSVEGLAAFSAFVGHSVLVAHNLAFDLAMLKAGFARHGVPPEILLNPMFDTLDLARRVYPDLKSFKLVDLIESLHLNGSNTHNAIDDVHATSELMMRLVENASSPINKQADAIRAYERVIYRFRDTFSPLWQRIRGLADCGSTYRSEFTEFIRYCFAQNLYTQDSLISYEDGPVTDPQAFVLKRSEKFMRYTDDKYKDISAQQPFLAVLDSKYRELSHFKEVDMWVGDEHIVVSTIHKAKGLQFDRVILMRCEDDVFPNFFCETPEQISESARVLYVGMTRTKRHLILLHSGKLSRFLEPVKDCFQQDMDIFGKSAGHLSQFFTHPDWLMRFRYLIGFKQKQEIPHGINEYLADSDANVRSVAHQLSEKCQKINKIDL